MKDVLGIVAIIAWGAAILPFVWRRLFPDSQGLSAGMLIVAILFCPIFYRIGSKVGEAFDKPRK